MPFETISLIQKKGIATVTLRRPDALNTFNAQMRSELVRATEALYGDDNVRVVVFTGAGRAFSAGGDIRTFNDSLLTPAYRAQLRQITRLYDDLEALEKPVVAALNGPATGAGIGLALACDIRFASAEATLGFREQFLGLISAAGGCSRLVRLVGLGRAKELMFTGEMISAAAAEKLGLVNRVVPAESLLDETYAFAEKLAQRAPQALGLMKRVLNTATSVDQSSSVVLESLAQSILMKTQDHKEGIDAFLAKRKPGFQGK